MADGRLQEIVDKDGESKFISTAHPTTVVSMARALIAAREALGKLQDHHCCGVCVPEGHPSVPDSAHDVTMEVTNEAMALINELDGKDDG